MNKRTRRRIYIYLQLRMQVKIFTCYIESMGQILRVMTCHPEALAEGSGII